MRRWFMVVGMVSSFTACATDADEADTRASEQDQAITGVIGETFDELVPGPIGGQNGWEGNCLVTSGTNKHLKCTGSQFAAKEVGFHGAGSYTSLIDLGVNGKVVNSTQGKIAYDGPQGRVFQILVGCDNIRVAFQMFGPTAVLASFPCQSTIGSLAYRVVCNWSVGGTVLSCAAARRPADPTDFIDLALPSGIRPFDRVSINSLGWQGATLYDNVFIWQNE